MASISLPTIFKWTNCLGAIGIFFVAIYRLILQDYITSSEGVVSMYLFFFGELLLATEFGFRFIRILFGFLTGPLGKGTFLIFCGSLFLSKKVNIVCVIGGLLILLGILNMVCYAWLKPKGGDQAEGGQEPGQPSQNTPEKKKYTPKSKKQKEQEMKNIKGQNTKVELDFENPSKPSDLFAM